MSMDYREAAGLLADRVLQTETEMIGLEEATLEGATLTLGGQTSVVIGK